jgi:hypothetical protein
MSGLNWHFLVPWSKSPQAGLMLLKMSLQDPAAQNEDEAVVEMIGLLEISEEVSFMCVAPAPERLLKEAFGTNQPIVDVLEENASALCGALERGEAVFFPVFEEGVPTQWCFAGASECYGVTASGSRRSAVPDLRGMLATADLSKARFEPGGEPSAMMKEALAEQGLVVLKSGRVAKSEKASVAGETAAPSTAESGKPSTKKKRPPLRLV